MNWNKAVGNKSEETQREKVMENIVETLRDFEDRMRRFNMHIIRISEGEQRKWDVRTFKGIISANF